MILPFLFALGESSNPQTLDDRQRILQVTRRITEWSGAEEGLGSPGKWEVRSYRALIPNIKTSEGFSRIAPSPDWSVYEILSAVSFGEERYYASTIVRRERGREIMVTISVGNALKIDSSRDLGDTSSYRLKSQEEALVQAGHVLDALNPYQPEWTLVPIVDRFSNDSPIVSYHYALNWNGFVANAGVSFSLHRTTGLASNLNFEAPLIDSLPTGPVVAEPDCKDVADYAVRTLVFEPLFRSRGRKVLGVSSESGESERMKVVGQPMYQWTYEALDLVGNRTEDPARYLVSVDALTGKVLGVSRIRGQFGTPPSSDAQRVTRQFSLDLNSAKLLIDSRAVWLRDCTVIEGIPTELNRTGWYSQGDFLFPVAYNEATGEMEIRTPDQVRYYRLPPGMQTQAR